VVSRDKSTKLETIFDRIELVAARFAVLKAQAQADLWRAVAGGEPQAVAQEKFDAQCRQIDEDMAFLRQANRGSERMDDAAVERVRAMATRYLWADAQGAEQPLLNDNEVENLTIRAGTLTGAEREVINHHIVATIQMLEKLPWPKHLARVPEYAGGHHEKMDGTGYPAKLSEQQLPLQARIMAIAVAAALPELWANATNSSPPKRPSTMPGSIISRMIRAAWRSAASPPAWPC
jgi:hypothetical protein